MITQQTLQELGIEQARIINRFFDLKIETLFALLKPQGIMTVYPLQQTFGQINTTLAMLSQHMEIRPVESLNEERMRMRGCQALHRLAIKAIARTRAEAMIALDLLDEKMYSEAEWTVVMDTLDSLVVILDSNLYLLEKTPSGE